MKELFCFKCCKKLTLVESQPGEAKASGNYFYECPNAHIWICFNYDRMTGYSLYLDVDNNGKEQRNKIEGRNSSNGITANTSIETKEINKLTYVKDGYYFVGEVNFMMPLPISEDGKIMIDDKFIDRINKLIPFS